MSARVWRWIIVICQSMLIASTAYGALTAFDAVRDPVTDTILISLGFSAMAVVLLGALWLWFRGKSVYIRAADAALFAGTVFILPGTVLVVGTVTLDAVLLIDIAAAAVVALFAGRGIRDDYRPDPG